MLFCIYRPEPTFQPLEDVIVVNPPIEEVPSYEEFADGLGTYLSSTLSTTVKYDVTDISFATTPEPEGAR